MGVILNLSLWFALHVLFQDVGRAGFGPVSFPWPEISSLDAVALGLIGVAAVLMLGLGQGLIRSLTLMALLGVAIGIM